jgi:heat shock protein 5
MGNADLMMLGAFLAVAMSAVFAAVFNPPPPKPGVVGIDLGTTFSVIALFHNGSVEVVPDHLKKILTPSVVAFAEQGKVLVGHEAQKYGLKHPKSMAFDAKRYIGHNFTEETVQRDKELVPFDVVNVDGKAHIQVMAGDKKLTMSPQTVGSHVLRKLKRQAEDYIGRSVLMAVLAVPADFTEEQRNATIEAGRMAGLDVLRVISEPTAAALAYGLQEMAAANILVYDFGGGTLDVSLLRLESGVFEVQAACGDEHLGGQDLNMGLLEYLLEKFYKETGIRVTDFAAVDTLRNAVEEAKISLSSQEKATVSIPHFYAGKPLTHTLTRGEVERVWGPLLERAIWPVQQVLEISGYEPSDVDEIVLVGGTTRVPYIRKMMHDFFRKEANWRVDPDQAVAWGTALQAGILTDAKGIKMAATEHWKTSSLRCNPLARPHRTLVTLPQDRHDTGA